MKAKIIELLGTREIKKLYKDLNGHKYNFVTNILTCAGKKNEYYYWPLCLDDARDKNSLEIDTCSTSYCVSILSIIKNRTHSNEYDECIKGGLKTLLKLRLSNGTFPPVIDISSLDKKNVEYTGGIAMSDNYFALTTFLDAGFLNKEFEYQDILPRDLKDYKKRVEFVLETIRFFNDNMVEQKSTGGKQRGWYYTNDTHEKEPVFLTTINIVLLLNRIANILHKNAYCSADISYISDLAQKGVEFLTYNSRYIKLARESYFGIGEKIGSNTISLIHSCKMVDAFISSNSHEYDDEIISTLQLTILKMCEDWFFADTYNYSERFQLLKSDKTKYQNILHESYPESVVLFTIINILKYSLANIASEELKRVVSENLDTISSTICYLIKRLEKQRSQLDQFNGFFKSHIRRNDGDYPIYASAESYKAIIIWEDLFDCLNNIHTLTKSEAISVKNKYEAQILRLTEYKNNPEHIATPEVYASSIKECDVLIEELEELIKKLTDSNYTEQETFYNDNLYKRIKRVL